MRLIKFVSLLVVCVVAFQLVGCGNGSAKAPTGTATVDYEAEARDSIDASNMEAELDKLEQEIESDNPDSDVP